MKLFQLQTLYIVRFYCLKLYILSTCNKESIEEFWHPATLSSDSKVMFQRNISPLSAGLKSKKARNQQLLLKRHLTLNSRMSQKIQILTATAVTVSDPTKNR